MVCGCVTIKIKKIAEELLVLGSGNHASIPRTWLTYWLGWFQSKSYPFWFVINNIDITKITLTNNFFSQIKNSIIVLRARIHRELEYTIDANQQWLS